jgi:hypothetical protein
MNASPKQPSPNLSIISNSELNLSLGPYIILAIILKVFGSSSNLRVFETGEYISLPGPPNSDLFFLTGVFGICFFYFLALCILVENPYSGMER